MTVEAGGNPALTVAIAGAVGMVAQLLARHLRIPGIVLLLAAGVLLGPDVGGIIDPEAMGDALPAIVGFAVAVILFEGGLNLEIRRLRREAAVIRRLVTWGAIVTALGGAISARVLMKWPWETSILFGTLVIVTGPTVITPLLRRIRLKGSAETVLEAEGVLIDAIGAVIAVVALEIALRPTGLSFAEGILDVVIRIGAGALVGALGGVILAGALRVTWLVPETFTNVFVLASVLFLFQASNALIEESGIAAVTVAGLVVGNLRTRVDRDLREFKEQLTVLFIGVLFVLLAADVRIAEVESLGLPGVYTVLALMFIVRPLNVFSATVGTDLGWRERTFLSWMAPRGIVAAAVASLFAQTLDAHGMSGGSELRALVFLVIAITVVSQGLTGGLLARILGLRRPSGDGYVILGANALALELGRVLRGNGKPIVFIDASGDACRAAEDAGFRVIFGNALDERTRQRARLDSRSACVCLTPNEEVNLLFAQHVREESRELKIFVALHLEHARVRPAMVEEAGGTVLFGEPRFLALWTLRLGRGLAVVERWIRDGGAKEIGVVDVTPDSQHDRAILPLAVARGSRSSPIEVRSDLERADTAWFVIFEERRKEAEGWLGARGWIPAEEDGSSDPGGGAAHD